MRRLTLPASIDCLGEVKTFVYDLAQAGGLSVVRTGRLRLAAEELVTNSITHGYGNPAGEGYEIVLEGSVEKTEVWLRVSENAPRFDPTCSRTPQDLDLPLSQREPGGLGLYLTRQAADRMVYDYSQGRNHVTVYILRDSQVIAPGSDLTTR